MTDASGDFAIDLLRVLLRIFGLDRSAENDPRGTPHPPGDSQTLRFGFSAKNLSHLVVENFESRGDFVHDLCLSRGIPR